MTEKTKTKKVNLNNFSVKELRQRCFVRKSAAIFNGEYTFIDDAPEQIEALPGFTTWESFAIDWDIYWVGLDPRALQWVAGRHNSPVRQLVLPLRIVAKDQRNNRMLETFEDKDDVRKLEVPFKEPIQETEEDRIISDSLSGKVVVDEPDADKAIRLIQKNMEMLQGQLSILMKK